MIANIYVLMNKRKEVAYCHLFPYTLLYIYYLNLFVRL